MMLESPLKSDVSSPEPANGTNKLEQLYAESKEALFLHYSKTI